MLKAQSLMLFCQFIYLFSNRFWLLALSFQLNNDILLKEVLDSKKTTALVFAVSG